MQAEHVSAKKGCTCGCGTIEFVSVSEGLPRSKATRPVQVEGLVDDVDGNEVGGLLLFVRDGQLHSLEIYCYAEPPLPLPPVAQVRWTSVDR